jgi:ABC-type multidrug transport system fused ATPase/permease subunit
MSNLYYKIKKNKIITFFKWIFVNQKDHVFLLFILFLTLVMNILTACITPFFLKIILDSALPTKNIHLLYILFSIIVILFVLSVIGTFAQCHIAVRMTENIVNKIRLKLFQKIQNINFEKKDSPDRGELLLVSNQNVNFLGHSMSHIIWGVSQSCDPLLEPHRPQQVNIQTEGKKQTKMRWAQSLKRAFNINIEMCGGC